MWSLILRVGIFNNTNNNGGKWSNFIKIFKSNFGYNQRVVYKELFSGRFGQININLQQSPRGPDFRVGLFPAIDQFLSNFVHIITHKNLKQKVNLNTCFYFQLNAVFKRYRNIYVYGLNAANRIKIRF